MDDSPFNSSYFWSPVPTVQGQVETNLLLELSWNTHGIVVCAMSKATQKGSPVWLSGPYVKPYMSADTDLTLSDNARLTSHRSCVNVSAYVCESLSDNISVSPLQPLCAFILSTFCISLDFFLFWLSSPFIIQLLPFKLTHPLTPLPVQQLCVLHSMLPFFLFWALFPLFFPNGPDIPHSWSSFSNPVIHTSLFLTSSFLAIILKWLILLAALLLHVSRFLALTTKLPLYSSSRRWRTPCSWTKQRSSLVRRRPVHPLSLTPLHLPPPRPITPQLCWPFLDPWRQEPGCVWSQNKREVGALQEGEEAVVGATVAVHH